MKIIGIGNDIIEVSRVKKAVEGHDEFLSKMFTESELMYFEKKSLSYETISGNFAAKEAVVKALGTGFIGIGATDFEIIRNEAGKPIFKDLKEMFNDIKIEVSISHVKEYATAVAIAYKVGE